jgi:hypothetical protein
MLVFMLLWLCIAWTCECYYMCCMLYVICDSDEGSAQVDGVWCWIFGKGRALTDVNGPMGRMLILLLTHVTLLLTWFVNGPMGRMLILLLTHVTLLLTWFVNGPMGRMLILLLTHVTLLLTWYVYGPIGRMLILLLAHATWLLTWFWIGGARAVPYGCLYCVIVCYVYNNLPCCPAMLYNHS